MLGTSMRIPRAHPCPVRTIFRRVIVGVNRIGGPRVDSEHPLHSTHDTPYYASYCASNDGTDGAGGLVAN